MAFAKNTRDFINKITKTITSIEYSKQLVRSSGSVGANYIEANESLSKKDFFMRIKICRKEAKESIYWLRLLEVDSVDQENIKKDLIREATELMKIFGSIIEKSK